MIVVIPRDWDTMACCTFASCLTRPLGNREAGYDFVLIHTFANPVLTLTYEQRFCIKLKTTAASLHSRVRPVTTQQHNRSLFIAGKANVNFSIPFPLSKSESKGFNVD